MQTNISQFLLHSGETQQAIAQIWGEEWANGRDLEEPWKKGGKKYKGVKGQEERGYFA
jgi:hypothetical protein